jgi:hypothetical protein
VPCSLALEEVEHARLRRMRFHARPPGVPRLPSPVLQRHLGPRARPR